MTAAVDSGIQFDGHIAMSRAILIIATAGIIVFSGGTVRSDETVPQCTLQLSVTLQLEVRDAIDPAFLSSLIGNHADFRIFVLRQVSSHNIVVAVLGPGPAYRCEQVLNAMNHDARVESIQVVSSTGP